MVPPSPSPLLPLPCLDSSNFPLGAFLSVRFSRTKSRTTPAALVRRTLACSILHAAAARSRRFLLFSGRREGCLKLLDCPEGERTFLAYAARGSSVEEMRKERLGALSTPAAEAAERLDLSFFLSFKRWLLVAIIISPLLFACAGRAMCGGHVGAEKLGDVGKTL